MSRTGVLALAAVVIGGLAVLWYAVFRDDGSRAAPAPSYQTAPPATAASPSSTTPAPALAPTAPGKPAVTLGAGDRRAAPPDTSELEVRDHRTPSTGTAPT